MGKRSVRASWHPSKAVLPIAETDEGSVRVASPEQPRKAYSPTEVTKIGRAHV